MTQKTLVVSEETHKRLNDIGKKNETYDQIIARVLNKIERKKVE